MEIKKVLGVGIIVIRDGKILLGRRKGAHGAETWAVPGGRVDTYEKSPGIMVQEEPAETAIRELWEETGLKVIGTTLVGQTSHFFEELGQEHISIYIKAEVLDGEPVVMEPEKCHEWGWFNWNHLPHPLFPLFKHFVNAGIIPEGIVGSA